MGITFDGVGASYGELKALEDIHLTLRSGVTAVMGKNGAGKSTLLELAAGIRQPDTGMLLLDGQPYQQSIISLHQSLGYLPQELDFPDHLTSRSLITYLAGLRFLDPADGLKVLDRLGGLPLADRRFDTLSTGEIRLAGMAQAFMGSPRFLILDEFSRSMGPEDHQKAIRLLMELAPNRIILFSTHLCADVETLANRVILLEKGRIGFDGTPAALIHLAAGEVHRMMLPSDCELNDPIRNSISFSEEINGKKWIRMVGAFPDGMQGEEVAPTFEEACLWFLRKRRE
jgi:ABC-2 type transport system ATP-binding protein